MRNVASALSKSMAGRFTIRLPLEMESEHRIIIFSDQHKGGGRGGDDFEPCKPAYLAALTHYQKLGFTLVLLGDAEELWEEDFKRIRGAHEDVLRLEGSFPQSAYFRIWGNHDLDWAVERKVRKHLSEFMPSEEVNEGLCFHVTHEGIELGRLFLVHGHQGTPFSDRLARFSRLFLPLYRKLQDWFGIGKTTPAKDFRLREGHDREMYRWARSQDGLILVAGHTHRPVWSSMTHLDQLVFDLAIEMNKPMTDAVRARVAELEAEIEDRREKSKVVGDEAFHTSPVYFNTGCCRFSDGDITGIELEMGDLRLIKWSGQSPPSRTVLESGRIVDFFRMLP